MAECDRCEEARALINHAVDLITADQIWRWCGVRTWLERECPHAPIDTRWRPMRSAPRDGTFVELLYYEAGSQYEGVTESDDFNEQCIAWRPAHPEWNEEQSDE